MSDAPLWPHFKPLWQQLMPNEHLQLAGGYGLFLKQKWLLKEQPHQIVVPFENWIEIAPRVTKDMDVILGLDLIANEESHQEMITSLTNNGFTVGKKDSDKRWKFVKKIDETNDVILELHAPKPSPDEEKLTATNRRVKHKPSLGESGVHGRTNPEAIGSELLPTKFQLEDIEIPVVNAVTFTVMKLTAMRDLWGHYQSAEDESERDFTRTQAEKHAQDVCRIVAMMSEVERDQSAEIISSIKAEDAFAISREIWRTQEKEETPPVQTAKANWQDTDFSTIASVLASWFE